MNKIEKFSKVSNISWPGKIKCVLCVFNTHREVAVRTNIVIDDKLLKEAFSVSMAKTKKDLIHEALRELIRFRKRKYCFLTV